ncbi:helix-turn-helix domain-containing protein [Castellaniella sp.]|uniref:helix-turn-helix domain-containing protein n=1 Tax=Castellaniella sp. TaxID=1955812 RepID=UPI003A948297
MRERLDCALLASGQEPWVSALAGVHLNGRLQVHALPKEHLAVDTLLDDPALMRGRYDAGVLYADEASLPMWRTALAARAGRLPAALLVYAVGLKAQAVHDLIGLGVSDFIRPPFCPEELRARLESVLCRLAPAHVAEPNPLYGSATGKMALACQSPTEADLCESILGRSGEELEAYAVALAMQRATSRESFREAKGQVVARFEKAYICAALGRHGGNITLAARMAQKHRRAFWALMRKHGIDPTPYRAEFEDITRSGAGKIQGHPLVEPYSRGVRDRPQDI